MRSPPAVLRPVHTPVSPDSCRWDEEVDVNYKVMDVTSELQFNRSSCFHFQSSKWPQPSITVVHRWQLLKHRQVNCTEGNKYPRTHGGSGDLLPFMDHCWSGTEAGSTRHEKSRRQKTALYFSQWNICQWQNVWHNLNADFWETTWRCQMKMSQPVMKVQFSSGSVLQYSVQILLTSSALHVFDYFTH